MRITEGWLEKKRMKYLEKFSEEIINKLKDKLNISHTVDDSSLRI